MFTATLTNPINCDHIIARIHCQYNEDGYIFTSHYFRLEVIHSIYVDMSKSDDWQDGNYWEDVYGYTYLDTDSDTWIQVTEKCDYYLLDRMTDHLCDDSLYM